MSAVRWRVRRWFAQWTASAIGSWLIARSTLRPRAASMPVDAPPPPANRSTTRPPAPLPPRGFESCQTAQHERLERFRRVPVFDPVDYDADVSRGGHEVDRDRLAVVLGAGGVLAPREAHHVTHGPAPPPPGSRAPGPWPAGRSPCGRRGAWPRSG